MRQKYQKSIQSILEAFEKNKGLITNILRKYSIHKVDVDDLRQETILRAFEALKRTEIHEPERFLVGIAKNIAKTELERRSRKTLEIIEDFDNLAYISEERGVEEAAETAERIEAFSKAVATLPGQCRKVFVLKYVYGATHKEIAAKMDIAISTVEKHVALGLKRCREEMRSNLGIEEFDNPASKVFKIEG